MTNAAPEAPRTPMRMSENGLDLVKAFENCMAVIKSRPISPSPETLAPCGQYN